MMASNLLRPCLQPRSVVIPDEKAQIERLQSIAVIQQRLQTLLDEGRLLRQSIEIVSGEKDARFEAKDAEPSARIPARGRPKKKSQS
jgi:hypothetical protein